MRTFATFCLILDMVLLLTGGRAVAQNNEPRTHQPNVYVSSSYSFKIQYDGTLVQRSKDEYVIELPTADQSNAENEVRVFVSQRPFVYLPGTYGGKYYFKDDRNGRAMSKPFPGDSISVNGIGFARDYWAVYAGMGQWETVINWYALYEGQYYVVS